MGRAFRSRIPDLPAQATPSDLLAEGSSEASDADDTPGNDGAAPSSGDLNLLSKTLTLRASGNSPLHRHRHLFGRTSRWVSVLRSSCGDLGNTRCSAAIKGEAAGNRDDSKGKDSKGERLGEGIDVNCGRNNPANDTWHTIQGLRRDDIRLDGTTNPHMAGRKEGRTLCITQITLANRVLRSSQSNASLLLRCLPDSPTLESTEDTSRPVTVVSASTGSLRVVEVRPVVSTTTEPTSTSSILVTSVRLV